MYPALVLTVNFRVFGQSDGEVHSRSKQRNEVMHRIFSRNILGLLVPGQRLSLLQKKNVFASERDVDAIFI